MFPSMPESNLAATTHVTLRIFGGAVAQLRARGDLGGQTYWCSGLKILQKPPRYTTNGIGRIVLERTGIAKVSATFPFRSDHPLWSSSLLAPHLSQHSSPSQASRPSRSKNQTMPSEANGSIHQAPISSCATSPTTTTKANQPQVMLSTASVRRARLPRASASRNYGAKERT